jgi:hypothetical protein
MLGLLGSHIFGFLLCYIQLFSEIESYSFNIGPMHYI